jgi:hypothetical protein
VVATLYPILLCAFIHLTAPLFVNQMHCMKWLLVVCRSTQQTSRKYSWLHRPTYYKGDCNVIFNVHGSVRRRESMSVTVQQGATMYSLLYFCKLLYMFRVVIPPIIRSTYNCNYSIWHWSNFGKCSVWSQLKMRGMDPTVCATFLDRTIEEGSTDGRVHTSHL